MNNKLVFFTFFCFSSFAFSKEFQVRYPIDGVLTSTEKPDNGPIAHGVQTLSVRKGNNYAIDMSNGRGFTGSLLNVQKGGVTGMSFMIGTYSGAAVNGNFTLSVCVADKCSTSIASTTSAKDNQQFHISLPSVLNVKTGDRIVYTLTNRTISGRVPALWTSDYMGSTKPEHVSTISGYNYYPSATLNYN